MRRRPRDSQLRTVPLFQGLRDRELERISALADIIDVPAERRIMSQGERGAEMFVLVSGTAHIERDGASLGDRGPGEVLGEIALLDGGPRTATVVGGMPYGAQLKALSRRVDVLVATPGRLIDPLTP